ncbi:2-phosphosulfolactate phosphatase [Fervidobacterium thailandense]|uniref:2-phosphosulfolactate phosphatase n=1 Tax=Fervidobacterium thailandense TaxID=1008305 RepID=UPI000845C06A|nr:2-phosphosulfolactate phosphatase [Fervidobacterium thailandense]
MLFLPDLRPTWDLEYDTAVVIDVLRATTTIVTALANGALEVVPVASLEEAMEFGKRGYLVCGERGGLKPPEFDLGNSPLDYTRDRVEGRKICITTSNGTKAILCALNFSKRVFLGSFLNLSTLAERLKNVEKIIIICAGNEKTVSFEDCLLAGAIVSKLVGADVSSNGPNESGKFFLSDSAMIVKYLWESVRFPNFHGVHAKKLRELGFSEDVEFAKSVDLYSVVPEFDGNKIVPTNR